MKHGENHVITGNAIVIWDGITKPEVMKNGQPCPPKFSLKLALQPNDPCIAEIEAISKAALQASEFKGVMPHGGCWPLMAANPQLADGVLNGMITINPKTNQADIAQKVYDASGQLLNPMTYGRMLYPGALIQVMIHAFPFNNVQKGIGLGLDGIRIVDATVPALNIGAAMPAAEVAAAFGAVAGGQGTAPVPPVYQGAPGLPAAPPVAPAPPMPPVVPAPDFLQPPAHQMTAAAQGSSYEAMCAAGWNDATLRQHGMML